MKGSKAGEKDWLWESVLRHLVHQYSSDVADCCSGRLLLVVPYRTVQLLLNCKPMETVIVDVYI